MERELRAVLDWWSAQGVDVPDVPAVRTRRAPKADPDPKGGASAQAAPKPKRKRGTPQSSGDPATLAAGASTLAELKAVLDRFEAGALTAEARQAVFARGNPEARMMIVGEAPGRDEDRHGLPFVGRSGQLLDRMMGAIGLDEQGFYVTNVVNWRPAKNRTPNAGEIELCKPFLMRHIALAEPDLLVLTGNVPLSAMTGQTGIMRQRGHWREVEVPTRDGGTRHIEALPIYHPAFLLRQPALKKDAWRDLLSLRLKLDALEAV